MCETEETEEDVLAGWWRGAASDGRENGEGGRDEGVISER